MKYWVTYGEGHCDASGQSLRDRFSTIEASSPLEAHRIIAAIRGGKWAFLYSSADDAGVDKYHLTEAALEAHREPRRTDDDELLHNEPPR